MSMTKGLFVFLSTYMPTIGWRSINIAMKSTIIPANLERGKSGGYS